MKRTSIKVRLPLLEEELSMTIDNVPAWFRIYLLVVSILYLVYRFCTIFWT